jgi:bacteriocin biosynthesis cyclodehydratase domain-containing protein
MSSDPRKPGFRLRPGLAVIPMDDAVQLRAGDEEIHLIETDTPDVVEKLLAQLSEGLGPEALGKTAGREHADLVDTLIDRLAAERLLLNEPIDQDDEIARYLSHFMGYAPYPEVRRPTGPVWVTGHSAGVDLLAEALGEHGVEVYATAHAGPSENDDTGRHVEAIVCIWERPDLPMVLRVNAAACRRRTPCLFVDLSHGRHATLGPFYVPGEGACYHCFRQRWRQNTAAPAEFDAAESAMLDRQGPLPAYGTLPAFRYQVVGMACGELFAFLSRHRPLRTLNRAATVDLEGLRLWTEPSWQIPWCPTCGADA